MKKKISKEELEDILHAEKIEAQWNSINTKKLNDIEKEREEYLNYTKKEYHPDSYTIKKELDEWENNSPIFAEFEQQKFDATVRSVLYVSLWFTIGLVVIKALLL